jgi:hypothetical protein
MQLNTGMQKKILLPVGIQNITMAGWAVTRSKRNKVHVYKQM